MMVNFYEELRQLLKQIPRGQHTSPSILADAMGDKDAEKAVIESITRPELGDFKDRVVKIQEGKMFSDFKTEKPLRRLADKQLRLANEVIDKDEIDAWNLLAGVDAAYDRDVIYAACTVHDREGTISSSSVYVGKVHFPYIPGYLYYREGPALVEALRKVSDFDILIVNGHGVAHPRGLGMASHVGLLVNKPTIGASRGPLIGEAMTFNNGISMNYSSLVKAVRIVRNGSCYVSVGHKISLATAVEIVNKNLGSGSLPAPIMKAHYLAMEVRRSKAFNC